MHLLYNKIHLTHIIKYLRVSLTFRLISEHNQSISVSDDAASICCSSLLLCIEGVSGTATRDDIEGVYTA